MDPQPLDEGAFEDDDLASLFGDVNDNELQDDSTFFESFAVGLESASPVTPVIPADPVGNCAPTGHTSADGIVSSPHTLAGIWNPAGEKHLPTAGKSNSINKNTDSVRKTGPVNRTNSTLTLPTPSLTLPVPNPAPPAPRLTLPAPNPAPPVPGLGSPVPGLTPPVSSLAPPAPNLAPPVSSLAPLDPSLARPDLSLGLEDLDLTFLFPNHAPPVSSLAPPPPNLTLSTPNVNLAEPGPAEQQIEVSPYAFTRRQSSVLSEGTSSSASEYAHNSPHVLNGQDATAQPLRGPRTIPYDENFISVSEIKGCKYANSQTRRSVKIPRRVGPHYNRDLMQFIMEYITLDRKIKFEELYEELELPNDQGILCKKAWSNYCQTAFDSDLSKIGMHESGRAGPDKPKNKLTDFAFRVLHAENWGETWFGIGCKSAGTRSLFWPENSTLLLISVVRMLSRIYENLKSKVRERNKKEKGRNTVSSSPPPFYEAFPRQAHFPPPERSNQFTFPYNQPNTQQPPNTPSSNNHQFTAMYQPHIPQGSNIHFGERQHFGTFNRLPPNQMPRFGSSLQHRPPPIQTPRFDSSLQPRTLSYRQSGTQQFGYQAMPSPATNSSRTSSLRSSPAESPVHVVESGNLGMGSSPAESPVHVVESGNLGMRSSPAESPAHVVESGNLGMSTPAFTPEPEASITQPLSAVNASFLPASSPVFIPNPMITQTSGVTDNALSSLICTASEKKKRKYEEFATRENGGQICEVELPPDANLVYLVTASDADSLGPISDMQSFRHTDPMIAAGAFVNLKSSFEKAGHQPSIGMWTTGGFDKINTAEDWDAAVLGLYNAGRREVMVSIFI